ncbi:MULTISPECIES: DUF1517 domain-containing protein [unclassified Thermosynechococcus]|uniref:DUF1517 domain-containing protein n=1 Tax=unclassified Thermosynechococcus TaxID=2622553 RepID=UPI0019F8ED21|nr:MULTISPECIES: DUF1517 domain-containing protein [unclassified Thermosynechococcus]HIK36026.1 DUF1517 domain-containing protein [Thermosynechococcus sp. M98_K2018_005]HIK47938.1 DUF1517 domain-containing protein [Thermosynechococcus sp. M55_K2018_012]
MIKTFWQSLKSVTAIVAVGVLIAHLVLDSGAAWAARSGGRVGGGSFSRPAPTRSYPAPRSDYGRYAQPVPVYGGGFGFPFLIPFFGFGGGFGGLFTIIMIGVLANIVISTFRNFRNSGDDSEIYPDNPVVSLHTLHVGLLAQARELQEELNQLALTADTQSPEGLTKVLQEATLALLRHPQYWVYAHASSQETKLLQAETAFNQLALAERSKLSAETLSNYRREIKQTAIAPVVSNDVGDYIVVTLVVAATGRLKLPAVNNALELQQALQQLGSIGSDRLLAVEVLWQPQAMGDTLTADELLMAYPQLKHL